MREIRTFDCDKYIQERLREIDDIEERKFAKTLLLEGLGRIFHNIDDKYARLEERIANEIEIESSRYEVTTTIIHKGSYDPLNEFLFPVCMSDVKRNKGRKAGKSGQGSADSEEADIICTVYLEADDRICQQFLDSRYITGRSLDDNKEIRYRIQRCRRYQTAIADLYRLFVGNKIPWNTVHTVYSERFFDIVADSDLPLTALTDMELQWGKWQPYIRHDRMLLWNISTQYFETGETMMPCIDRIHYEYAVTVKDPRENGYLFERDGHITNITFESNKVIIRATTDRIENIKAYQFHDDTGHKSYQYDCPLISNRTKGSFCGRYLQKTGVFLQTRADLYRKIKELSGTYPIELKHYELSDQMPAEALLADMNSFIKEEAFPVEKRRIFVLFFRERPEEDCYFTSQIRYILSRLQQEYLEYKCVGVVE